MRLSGAQKVVLHYFKIKCKNWKGQRSLQAKQNIRVKIILYGTYIVHRIYLIVYF